MKKVVVCLIAGLLMLLPGKGLRSETGTGYLLPGDVKEGWKVFVTKRCSSCHSIWGEGGKGGPDLGSLPESYVSPAQLAALMWNHGPEMWGRMAAQRVPFPRIEKKEMADLFSFLYFLRYMDEPGDPEEGRKLLKAKGCSQCHSLKEGAAGDLTRWGPYVNPILWSHLMWNHAPQMEEEMRKKGLPSVEFKGNEMVDLIAYVRSVGPHAEKVYLSPGDPQSGKKLFVRKGCIKCHTSGGKLDLSKKKDFPRTLGRLAGAMWNHSHEMWKGMEEKGIARPSLSSNDMVDLVAYLFSTRYFDEPGDPGRGKTVLLGKQCNTCHTKGRQPDLSALKGRISPILMAQAMWNHGPVMLERMRKAKISWQKISGKEMVDLMEYLDRGMP
jgi:cytochrome c2